MNMKDLNAFITVAEEDNLTKASKLLYMTPQGVSKIIKNLENENDCELFLRTGNKMELTECGEHFYQYAKKTDSEYHSMRKELLHLKQKEHGVVDLLSAFGIIRLITPECIRDFREKYPDIEQAGIVVSKEEMGKLGVLAWDAGRLNFISRLCLEQEYIVKEECMQCINAAYEMTKEVYTNWKDYAYSYVLGRTLSMGTTNMIGLAEDLLTDTKSPWTYIKW